MLNQVFGLTHRATVSANGQSWVVRAVDVESMAYTDDGEFTKPVITGTPANDEASRETVNLGSDWTLESAK